MRAAAPAVCESLTNTRPKSWRRWSLVNSFWRRVVAGGALWAVVYNLVWGVAWFAFMREEWRGAAAAIRRPLPWTAEVWFVWVVLTIPIGVAIMAYAAGRGRTVLRAALSASAVIWLLFAVALSVHGVAESYSFRVLALDASVNLVGMLAGSLVGTWSLRAVPPN